MADRKKQKRRCRSIIAADHRIARKWGFFVGAFGEKLIGAYSADVTVVAERLRLQQPTVGPEADLPELWQVAEKPADAEVACVVDGGLGAKRAFQLEVLLDPGVLVADMQRGIHPMGDDARREPARRALVDSPVEDQADLVGTPQVQMVADHLLEPLPSMQRTPEHLGAGELRLQDRVPVAVAGIAVLPGERTRQTVHPLADHPRDAVLVKTIQNRLQSIRIITAQHPVVQRLIADARLVQLTLGVLMPVEVHPTGVRKVRAHLDEHRAEVIVHHVEVVVVAHHLAAVQPRIAVAGIGVGAPRHAERTAPLLRLADIQYPLSVIAARLQTPLRLIILSLTLAETHQIDAVPQDERADVLNKLLAHVLHEYRGRNRPAAVVTEEMTGAGAGLQHRLIDIQIQPVNALDVERDPVVQQTGQVLVYHGSQLRVELIGLL